jgi:phosphoglycolate phosphatase
VLARPLPRPVASVDMHLKRPAPFDLYIFDLDGTLVDSRADLTNAVNFCRADLGLPPLPPEVVEKYVGEGAVQLLERALGPEHHDRVATALGLFRGYYGEHLLDSTRPYPGVARLLEELRERGARAAVASNKPEAFSRAILEGLGLAPSFSLILGGDTLPVRKPDPAPVHQILRELAVEASQALLVGDSHVDIETARQSGIPVCAVTYGFESRETLLALGPDFLADEPAQVLEAARAG